MAFDPSKGAKTPTAPTKPAAAAPKSSAKTAPAKKGGGFDPSLGVAAPAAVELAPKKGKGGFLNDLKRTTLGLPGGLVRLVGGLAKEGQSQFESGRSLPDVFKDLGTQEGRDRLRRDMPITSEVASSPIKTIKTLNPQDLVDVARGDVDKTALRKRIEEEGALGTILATAGDLSLVAGGLGQVGKLAGGGRLVEAGRLAEAGSAAAKGAGAAKGANAAKLTELAEAAAKAGDTAKAGELTFAAEKLAGAEALKAARPASLLERGTYAAHKTGTLGANIAGAPAKPYEWAAKGATKAAQRIAPVATKLIGEEHLAKFATLKDKLGVTSNHRAFRKAYGREVEQNRLMLTHQIYKSAEKAARLVPDEVGQVATTLLMTEAPQTLAVFRAVPEAELAATVERVFPAAEGAVSVESVLMAADHVLGDLDPALAGRMDEAIGHIRTGIIEPSRARYERGFGTKRELSEEALTERKAQAGQAPLPLASAKVKAQREQVVVRRAVRAEAKAAKRTEALKESGPKLTVNQERRLAAKAELAKRAARREADEAARAERLAATGEAKVARAADRGEERIGKVVGRAREQMEEAGQLARGEARRAKQHAARSLRLEKQAEGVTARAETKVSKLREAAEKPVRVKKVAPPKPATAAVKRESMSGVATKDIRVGDEIQHELYLGRMMKVTKVEKAGRFIKVYVEGESKTPWEWGPTKKHNIRRAEAPKVFEPHQIIRDSQHYNRQYKLNDAGELVSRAGDDAPYAKVTKDEYFDAYRAAVGDSLPKDVAAKLTAQQHAAAKGAAETEAFFKGVAKQKAAEKKVTTVRAEASAKVSDLQAKASEAAKLGELKAPRTPQQVQRATDRAVKAADAATKTETKVAKAVRESGDRLQASALQRAETEAKSAAKVASDTEAKVRAAADERFRQALARDARTNEARRARTQEALAAAGTGIEDMVKVAPARYRPALIHAKRAAEVLREMGEAVEKVAPGEGANFAVLAYDLPQTLRQMVDAGIDVDYLMGGKPLDALGATGSAGGRARLSSLKATQGEQAKTGASMPRTFGEQADKFAHEVRTQTMNNFVRHVEATLGGESGVVVRPSELPDEYKALSGEALADAMADAGYVPFGFDKAGNRVKPAKVTADTAFIDKNFSDHFKSYFEPKKTTGVRALLPLYDTATRLGKHSMLALSPAWHTGNVMGNTVMATLGGGIGPVAMLKYGREAAKLIKAGQVPELLEARGYHVDDILRMVEKGDNRLQKAAGKTRVGRSSAGQALLKPIETSYALNEWVDNFNRTLVYQKNLGKGLSPQTAVEQALRVSGDFSNMTRFERGVVRRVIPFYAWQRHITKLAFGLPIAHPARVAWTLRLVDMADRHYPGPGADNPFALSSIEVGGKTIDLRPFGPFGSSFFANPSAQGAGYQLNPFIKIATVGALGRSPNRAFEPVNRKGSKFGEGAKGAFALRDPIQFSKFVAQQLPQTKKVQDFLAGEAPVRFETGEPRPGKSTERDRVEQLARFMGIPIPEPEQKPRKPIR